MRTTDSTRDSGVMGLAKRRFNANGGEGSATKYCAFISHQKSEGATIARFLHDSFQVICEADAFLDSADLFDLRDLMTHLQQSEAVVFVATRSALQSVWVLMELFVAVEKGIPIVPVFDSAFDAMAGQAYLSNLESQLGHHEHLARDDAGRFSLPKTAAEIFIMFATKLEEWGMMPPIHPPNDPACACLYACEHHFCPC